jgi:hypothetical protein
VYFFFHSATDSIDEHNTYGTIDERVELDDIDDIKNDERWVSTVD